METKVLSDKEIYPSEEVLKRVLGRSYKAYEELIDRVTGDLIPEWRYYKDGGSWLCKVCYRKKTIFWMSAWDMYFKVTFYFTEKTGSGIQSLDIRKEIKVTFSGAKRIGKLIPLTINIHRKEEIEDIIALADYKRSMK